MTSSSPAGSAPAGSQAGGAVYPHRRALVVYLAIALGGVVLDQVTKVLAVRLLDPQDPIRLAGGLLHLRLIRNPGAAFSIGENFTMVFAYLAMAVLVFIAVRLVPRLGHRLWAIALGLVSAGICGNLIDRIARPPGPLRGHVVDFLQLPHWPIFNVADMCVTSAAVLIVWCSFISGVGPDGIAEGKRGAA